LLLGLPRSQPLENFQAAVKSCLLNIFKSTADELLTLLLSSRDQFTGRSSEMLNQAIDIAQNLNARSSSGGSVLEVLTKPR
jgi:hypothetical protein